MVSIQDKNIPLTAEDLRQRYKLEDVEKLKNNVSTVVNNLKVVDNELQNFKNATLTNIENIQNQVDGKITTWYYDGTPTLNNEPAVNWTTNEEKNTHLGDLYFDKSTGYSYRFSYENNEYKWLKITDSDTVEALSLASYAKDTADNKRRVFVTTPSPPYDEGDLWSAGENGDLKVCINSKSSGESFSSSDWELAARYVGKNNVIQSINSSSESTQISKNKLATITADKIKLEGLTTINSKFKVNLDGTIEATDGVFSGRITASSGTIGGWNIASNKLSYNADRIGMCAQNNGIAFWAGANTSPWSDPNWSSNVPFYVLTDGKLQAKNADIQGRITATSGTIGGWTVTSTAFYSSRNGYYTTMKTTGDVAFTAGSTSPTDATYAPVKIFHDGRFKATNAEITGRITATSGTIAGWNITSTYLYYGGANGENGARLYRDGRIYMKNNYGWLNCGEGGAILNGNTVVITDSVGTSSTGSSNASIGIRTFYGNLRLASNRAIQLLATDFLDFGGSEIRALSSYHLAGHTFTGAGNAKMYANSNCLLAPARGYGAYINSTSSQSNRIATSSGGPSSRNVKTNIKNLSSTYDKVYEDLKNMQLYKYKYKYKGIKDYDEDYGFIIEEMEQLPTLSKITKHYEVEGYIEDGKLFPKRDEDEEQKKKTPFKYKEWDRDSYIKLLFVSIKALQEKIDDLEKELEKWKNQ